MKIVCFDMDNTLVKADRMHIVAFNEAFRSHGLPPVKADRLKKLFGIVGHEIVKKLFPGLSSRKIASIMSMHNMLVVTKTSRYAVVFPCVRAVLKRLMRRYKLGVISNCSHKEIEATLKNASILKFFDILVGNDDVRHGKPWPDEILKAKKLSHLKAGYMVGDTIYDVIAGRKAGVKTIAVLTGHHTRQMFAREKPDFIIKNLKELPGVLEDG